jgi:hypothetical protein
MYFSTWAWQAIHLGTSCPDLQTPQKISQALSLPAAKVEEMLRVLEERKLVKKEGQRWKYASGQAHLPAASPSLPAFLLSWRTKANEHGALNPGMNLHFTGVQALSKKDAGLLALMLRETLRRFHEVAGPSEPECLVNLNLDYWIVES